MAREVTIHMDGELCKDEAGEAFWEFRLPEHPDVALVTKDPAHLTAFLAALAAIIAPDPVEAAYSTLTRN